MDPEATSMIKAIAETLESSQSANLTASKLAQKAAETSINAQGRLSWQIVTQLGVWLVSVLLAYGLINTRLQVLEVKYDRMTQDMQEMKADLKQVIALAYGSGPRPLPARDATEPVLPATE